MRKSQRGPAKNPPTELGFEIILLSTINMRVDKKPIIHGYMLFLFLYFFFPPDILIFFWFFPPFLSNWGGDPPPPLFVLKPIKPQSPQTDFSGIFPDSL